jgi:S1-C subfamily serine protease
MRASDAPSRTDTDANETRLVASDVSVSRMRAGRRWAMVMSVAVPLVAGCSTHTHAAKVPAPIVTTPPLSVAPFLPDNYRMTSATPVDLDGSTTPQVAVSAVATGSNVGHAPSTVLLLTWSSTTHRWNVVFDASKQPSFAAQTSPGSSDQPAPAPTVAVVRDQPNGGADLVYWLNSPHGNVRHLLVEVVHYAHGRADIAFGFNTDEAGASLTRNTSVVVAGTAPFQQIQVTVPWNTQTDPIATAVRTYRFVVAPASNSAVDAYRVVSDDRPLAGVGIVAVAHSTQGRVTYVAAGTAAGGLLQLGDVIDGIDGIAAPSHPGFVPAVVDEVAVHHPGDKVTFDIVRQGRPAAVAVTLGQWNFMLGQTGYGGVASNALGAYVQVLQTSVVVNATVPGGPADTAGMLSGETLTSVNGIPIHTIADIQAALRGLSAGDTATIGYLTPQGTPATTRVALGPSSGTIPPTIYTL